LLPSVKQGFDFVVVARSGSASATYWQLLAALDQLLGMAHVKTDAPREP
jgi:ribonuclease P protein component